MAQVSVDISGRLDDFGEDTVIGFSNDHQGAIRLPRLLKEAATRLLRQQGKGRAFCKVRLYVIGLFLLLRALDPNLTGLTLDKDFAGWEGEIISMLLSYLRRLNSRLTPADIQFANVEEHRCHMVANSAFRGEFPALAANPEEFLRLIPVRGKKRIG